MGTVSQLAVNASNEWQSQSRRRAAWVTASGDEARVELLG